VSRTDYLIVHACSLFFKVKKTQLYMQLMITRNSNNTLGLVECHSEGE
jgi:hypothetical protein